MTSTSLAKDLWDRSKWFFRAKDEDAPPKRRQIAERLRDLSEYVGNLSTDDDAWVQHWDRVERLITPPLRPSRAFFFDVNEWEAVADSATCDEALETFIRLRSEDMISYYLRRLRADRGAVSRKARAVGMTAERFEEIATRPKGLT